RPPAEEQNNNPQPRPDRKHDLTEVFHIQITFSPFFSSPSKLCQKRSVCWRPVSTSLCAVCGASASTRFPDLLKVCNFQITMNGLQGFQLPDVFANFHSRSTSQSRLSYASRPSTLFICSDCRLTARKMRSAERESGS